MCVGVITHKNLPINAIGFSSDCSILSAGCGDILTIYDTNSLRIKCTLTVPSGSDGNINRIQVAMGCNKNQPKEYLSKREFYLEQIKLFLMGESHSLLSNITHEKKREIKLKKIKKISLNEIKSEEQKAIFNRIVSSTESSFDQKISALETLALSYSVSNEYKKQIADLLYTRSMNEKIALKTVSNNISNLKRELRYKKAVSFSLLRWKRKQQSLNHNQKWYEQFIESTSNRKKRIAKNPKASKNETSRHDLFPNNIIKAQTVIKYIFFGNEDYSHLLCVCTENRIFVWNLLNLRIQVAFKLTSKYACIDQQTNLIAIFSQSNELIVFHINSPLPLYNNKNMPDIFEMTWVPRKYPKARGNSNDWQAASQLYFLSTKQELLYMDHEKETNIYSAMYLNNFEGVQAQYDTPFASMIAQHIRNKAEVEVETWDSNKLGLNNVTAVKEVNNHFLLNILFNHFNQFIFL